MTYPTFISTMNQYGIQDTSQAEYQAARQLYMQDIRDGETTDCFCKWLDEHVSYTIMDGY